jgi:hypothetical protein
MMRSKKVVIDTKEFGRRVKELMEMYGIHAVDACSIVREFEDVYYLDPKHKVADFIRSVTKAQKNMRRKNGQLRSENVPEVQAQEQ